MPINNAAIAAWAPRMLSVLRIVSGYMFLLHGTSKLFGMPHAAMFDNLQLMSMTGVAGILELVGGVLLLLGAFTRPVAFVLSGEMAAAYFMVHAPHGFWPIINKGELAVAYCFVFLYIAAHGAGAFSLDGMRRKTVTGG